MNRYHPTSSARVVGRLLGFALLSSFVASCTSPSVNETPAASTPASSPRLTLNFNPDWRFIKDDPAGAQVPGFDDASWTTVSAPHTYNDVDTFDNWSTPGHRGEQIQWGGRTWYRKTFTAPAAWNGKKVFVEFESARQIAEVYLNGQLLGVSKSGFTPFGFDLTPHLKVGATNVLAVMVDNRFMKDALDAAAAASVNAATTTSGGQSSANPNLAEMNAKINETIPENLADLKADQIPWNNPHWHPAHGGLYRNVKLYVTDPLHISLPLYSFLETAGPYVYATAITDQSANISVEVPAQNARATNENVEMRAEIFDATGKSVLVLNQTQAIAAGGKTEFKVSGALAHPRLWEPAYPHLYRVVCALRVNGKTIDTSEVPLGVRAVKWETLSGFYINGQHVKLHGWGQKPTNEWPGLGAAQPNWMHFYTSQLMRDAGGNFVRWGHAASGPAQIAAGDQLGIVTLQPGVDGEHDTVGAAWKLRAMTFRDMVIYYRNNPSILIWEGGNQKVTREHAQELRGYMDTYDPHGGRSYAHRRADQISAEFMDVGVGTEGGREIAQLPVVEGEYNREESPRRVWDNFSPPNFGYPEAKGMTYQLTSEEFAVNEVGHYVKKLGAPEHSGGANWIFSDSTSGGRVPAEVARTSGEVDGVRLTKEAYYVCAAMFRTDPQVYIIGHWTYRDGTKKNVYVASNAQDVELFLNGKSLGHGKVSDKYLFTFTDVTWAPGEIKAVATTGGKVVATNAKHTIGAPVALKLTAITAPGGLRADGSDVALIDVEAVDANGERCPTFQQRIDFEMDGPATWRGGYNSGKINSTNNTFLDLEAGINRVAVRAGRNSGAITVRATGGGLKSGSVTITSKAFSTENGYAATAPAASLVTLPAQAPTHPTLVASASTSTKPSATKAKTLGRFIKALSYSGPHYYIVHVEMLAREGKNAYVDVDAPLVNLPAELDGADWVQTADKDGLYNAVDLMEIAVPANSTVSVAHDDRLPRPAWLLKQFDPTSLSLTLNGQPMKIFQRKVTKDESLTLGANSEDTRVKEAKMYLVFVNGAAR